jgi:hypothetical protein
VMAYKHHLSLIYIERSDGAFVLDSSQPQPIVNWKDKFNNHGPFRQMMTEVKSLHTKNQDFDYHNLPLLWQDGRKDEFKHKYYLADGVFPPKKEPSNADRDKGLTTAKKRSETGDSSTDTNQRKQKKSRKSNEKRKNKAANKEKKKARKRRKREKQEKHKMENSASDCGSSHDDSSDSSSSSDSSRGSKRKKKSRKRE